MDRWRIWRLHVLMRCINRLNQVNHIVVIQFKNFWLHVSLSDNTVTDFKQWIDLLLCHVRLLVLNIKTMGQSK